MVEAVRFVCVQRVIDPKTGVHYLDAIDQDGKHWTAEMSHRMEPWLVYTRTWKPDPQHPFNHKSQPEVAQ